MLGREEIVIGFPGKAAGDVIHFRVKLSGFLRFNEPVQRRLENCIVAQIGEYRQARQTETHLSAHFDDGLAVLLWQCQQMGGKISSRSL